MYKIGTLVDLSMFSEDGEAEQILSVLEDRLGADCAHVVAANGMHQIRPEIEIDVLVVDYGGLSVGGAHECAVAQIMAARRWAEDHPNAILLIWTWHTRELYEEADQMGEGLPNVRFYSVGEDDEDVFWAEIRAWLGREQPA